MPRDAVHAARCALVAVLVGLACAGGALPAAAQSPDSADPRELWEDYPLDPGPPEQTPMPTAVAPAATARATATPQPESGSPLPAVLGAGLAAALAAAAALLVARRRRDRRPAPAVAVAAGSSDSGSTKVRAKPAPAPRALFSRRGRLSPPDPAREWSAEIRWRHEGDSSGFEVVARAEDGEVRTLAHSAPLVWPPRDPAAVKAFSDALNVLQQGLASGGWRQEPSNGAWSAKRFTWTPARRPVAAAGDREGR